MREITNEFDLGFIMDSVESLPSMVESRLQYRNIDEESVKQMVKNILSEF